MKGAIYEGEFVNQRVYISPNALEFSPSLHQRIKESSTLTSCDFSNNCFFPRLISRKPVGSNEGATVKKKEAFAENATWSSAPKSGPHTRRLLLP